MKFRWDNRYLHWGVTAFLVVAASMLFYYGIFHMKTLIVGIKAFFSIMAPIIYGIGLAYILSSIVNFLEKKIIFPLLKKKDIHLKKRGRRVVRWICVLLSLFIFAILIYALIMMILPQLIRSIMNIIGSFPYYVSVVENWLTSFMERGWHMNAEVIDILNQYTSEAQDYLSTNIMPQMQEMLKNISVGVFDTITFIKNFLIGAIVSLYVLADKEIFVARSKMVVYSLFSPKRANIIIYAMRFTHKTFGGFINGKLLDSVIIGVLCYIGCTVLDMPYTILISVIVGVTNIIPFFGPYLGAIPCFLLILLVSPVQSLYFLIFILILQQFDGNILGPKILGDSTGLSSFMVIVAIMVGGGLFGVPGMIVGVPVAAVIYTALWGIIGHTLQNRDLPFKTEDYMNINCLDPKTKEAIPMPNAGYGDEKDAAAEDEEAHQDSLFLRLCNKLMALLLVLWKFLRAKLLLLKKKTNELRKKMKENKK